MALYYNQVCKMLINSQTMDDTMTYNLILYVCILLFHETTRISLTLPTHLCVILARQFIICLFCLSWKYLQKKMDIQKMLSYNLFSSNRTVSQGTSQKGIVLFISSYSKIYPQTIPCNFICLIYLFMFLLVENHIMKNVIQIILLNALVRPPHECFVLFIMRYHMLRRKIISIFDVSFV